MSGTGPMTDAAALTTGAWHAPMWIAGEAVRTERVIDVFDPYTGARVGTVPKATAAHVRRAFEAAAAFRSPLTRHERAAILRHTAERLAARAGAISDLITAESGLSKKDTLYEVGRACDVFGFAAAAALVDDAQVFSCDVSAHGRRRRIYTQREPLRAISAITPFNHPLNQVAHKVAPSIATNNRMVLKPSEKTPLTAVLLAVHGGQADPRAGAGAGGVRRAAGGRHVRPPAR